MTKQLLITAVALTAALGAQAADGFAMRLPQGAIPTPAVSATFDLANSNHMRVLADTDTDDTDAPTVTSGTLTCGYTTYVYSATSLGDELTNMSQAIGIPSKILSLYKDNSITSLRVPTGANFGDRLDESKIARDGYLWIARELGEEMTYIYKQDFKLTADPLEMNVIDLDTPFAIDGTPFFIGYTLEGGNYCADSAPVVFSYMPDYTGYGSIVGTCINGQYQWIDAGSMIGLLPIAFDIQGESIPLNALITYGDLSIPDVLGINDEFDATISMANIGYKTINSFGVSVYNTATPQEERETKTIDFSGDGMPGEPGIYTVTLQNLKPTAAGESPLVMAFTEVNGQPNMVKNGSELSADIIVLKEGKGFDRTLVIEDATGTWCQWCPYAHAVLEIMAEKYTTDQVIPIAVHSSTQGGDDPMNVMYGTSATYNGLNNYINGFPSMLLNRTSLFGVTPSLEQQLVNTIETSLKRTAAMKVEATIETDPNNALRPTIKTVVKSAAPFSGTRFLLSYVITEDELGPYIQTNGFAGTTDFGDAYGFANEPKYVSLMYNNVALMNSTFSGVRNSIPAEIEEDGTYEYSYKLSLKKVEDLNKYAINVLIIDQQTGAIANACRVYSPTYSGVEAVAIDTNDITVTANEGDIIVNGTDQFTVYDLSGRQVGSTNLPAGIYIVKTDTKTVKIAL